MGHTARLGNRADTDRLSMRRAVTVRDELPRLGVRLPMEVRAMGATEAAHAEASVTAPVATPVAEEAAAPIIFVTTYTSSV